MTTFTDDNEKLELLTKIAKLPPEQLKPVMKAMDRADMLAEFAKLPAFELSVMLAKIERHHAQLLAKGARTAKKTGRRGYGPDWGTPLERC